MLLNYLSAGRGALQIQRYHDKFKKHSLINQVWDEKNLEEAWKRVKANKGSAGIDGVTIPVFQQNLPQNLAEIQRLLKEKRYVPEPVKRVLIPKDNGKMRPLGIPTVRDRVVQQALKNVLDIPCPEPWVQTQYRCTRGSKESGSIP